MEMQELEIIIAADGSVTIQVNGVKGSACLDLTRELEEALGTVGEGDRRMKSDATPQARTALKVRTSGRSHR